jgi:hypothetical protein
MDIQTLKSLYAKGVITPEDVVNEVYKRLKLPTADPAVWLHLFPHAEAVKRARELLQAFPDPTTRHPLFGIPFSIKDSIDIKGVPTTAACPEYAYVADKDAPSYAALIEVGCIPIGKVNLVRPLSGRAPPSYLHFFLLRKGSISDRTRWDAVTIWPASICILFGLCLWWLLFGLMRLSCL